MFTVRGLRRRGGRILAALAVAGAAVTFGGTAPAQAALDGTTLGLYPPLQGTSGWANTPGTEPAVHHIVYSNFGYLNDWSVDVFAGPGRAVLSPFGSKTNNGHTTSVRVVGLRAGCASGAIADGGYRMTLEAKDNVTGRVLGRADLMHVNNPQVGVGAVVGPWTTLGFTAQFRYSSCYQVSTASGVHIHTEVIQPERYSCYVRRANGTAVTDNTRIGTVGVDKAGRRATC